MACTDNTVLTEASGIRNPYCGWKSTVIKWSCHFREDDLTYPVLKLLGSRFDEVCDDLVNYAFGDEWSV